MISVKPWQHAIIVAALMLSPKCQASELIRNGSFEKGNRDFRSDYPEGLGSYLVTRNLRNFHQKQSGNIGLFGDHTNGRGHMMAVDGATVAGKVVWEQTVNVLPNREYIFSMYVASWSDVSPAKLEVTINGKELGTIEASSKIGEWKRLNFKWQSELDTSAVIAIRNRNTSGDGNDFVIDDVSLQGPRPFPPEMDALWDKYEKDAAAIREKAKLDLAKRRQKLLAELQMMLDGLTKEGKLDEALVLRQQIATITEEFKSDENQ